MTGPRYIQQLVLYLSFVIFFALGGKACIAQTSGTIDADTTLTAEILCDTLYAKTDAEIEYCEFVVRMRDEKVLPNKILYYAYKKAMAQEKGRRFVYFRRVIETACDSQGIVLEDSGLTKAKKFFGFNTAATKAAAPETAVIAKPATQSTLSKPFAFLHRFFTR